MKKINKAILFAAIFACIGAFATIVYADSLAQRLSGKILLQVEQSGEAWYISPDNQQRYYLGRPADAFKIMRELGLGIGDIDLNSIPISPDSLLPSTETKKPAQEKSWQITHTFSGDENINTEPFTFTNGSHIKVKYTLNPNEYTYFGITLQNPDNFFDNDLIHNNIHENYDIVKNETNIYNKQNNTSYYLEISANGSWTIEILEYK